MRELRVKVRKKMTLIRVRGFSVSYYLLFTGYFVLLIT
jgi:hypothetical protein